MVRRNRNIDEEKLSDGEYRFLEGQKLLTEAEALQQETVVRIPGWVSIIKQYELRPISKIIASVLVMGAIWWLVGWDAVAFAVVFYILATVTVYLIVEKYQAKDNTVFVEMKLAGQRIRTGDHSPYTREFYVTESRFAVWAVPTALIRRGLFKVPGDQASSMLPGSGEVIYTDLFDRLNRTCVLPIDMDVANISLATNANPMTSRKLAETAEVIKLDKKTERTILDNYAAGNISEVDAFDILRPIRIRQRTLMDPTRKTKRDIFFDLQETIPQLREKVNWLSNKMFLLADFLAARGIYQTLNRAMPEKVRKDHNFVYKVLGLPPIEEGKRLSRNK